MGKRDRDKNNPVSCDDEDRRRHAFFLSYLEERKQLQKKKEHSDQSNILCDDEDKKSSFFLSSCKERTDNTCTHSPTVQEKELPSNDAPLTSPNHKKRKRDRISSIRGARDSQGSDRI